MAAPLSIDIIFVVMLGAAVWTSLQLSGTAACSSLRIPLRTLIERTALEGGVCAAVWLAITIVSTRAASVELALQSLSVGCVWFLFSFVARLPFRDPARVVE